MLKYRKDPESYYPRYEVRDDDRLVGYAVPTTSRVVHSRWEAFDLEWRRICTGSTRREVAETLLARSTQ